MYLGELPRERSVFKVWGDKPKYSAACLVFNLRIICNYSKNRVTTFILGGHVVTLIKIKLISLTTFKGRVIPALWPFWYNYLICDEADC